MKKSTAGHAGNKLPAMLGAIMSEKMPTPKQMTRDHAKRSMQHATEDWISGRITTKEHSAIHDRAKHVLKGKEPRQFKGTSGERKPKEM